MTHAEKMMRDIKAQNYRVDDVESGVSAMTRMLDDLRRHGYGWLSQELGDVFNAIPFDDNSEIEERDSTIEDLNKDVADLEKAAESFDNQRAALEDLNASLVSENEILLRENERLVAALEKEGVA